MNETPYIKRFKKRLSATFGHSLRQPRTVSLGYEDENGNQLLSVPSNRTDQPSKYYFHELNNSTAVGEAFLFAGVIESGYLRFNLPVRIQRDEVDGNWVIKGIDPVLGAHYVDGISTSNYDPIGYDEFLPGMLAPTEPPSMKARVLGTHYTLDGATKYIPTLTTPDMSVSPWSSSIPSTSGVARYVLVEVDYVTATLSLTVAPSAAPSGLLSRQVAELDAGTGIYMPSPANDRFRAGYIKLVMGMTNIYRDTHLWQQPEVYTKTSTLSLGSTLLSWIIIDDASSEIVIDDISGEVVWAEV